MLKKFFCPGTILWVGVIGLAIWAGLHTMPNSAAGEDTSPAAAEGTAIDTTMLKEAELSPEEQAKIHYRASTSDKPMNEVFPPPTKEEMKALLSPLQYDVCFTGATERPGSGEYNKNHKKGTYLCRICGLPLFISDTKFESGTGWPSFFQPVDPKHVKDVRDTSHGMERVESVCANCGSHLGHVFPDGPKPTGLRFCMNSASLKFVEAPEAK